MASELRLNEETEEKGAESGKHPAARESSPIRNAYFIYNIDRHREESETYRKPQDSRI